MAVATHGTRILTNSVLAGVLALSVANVAAVAQDGESAGECEGEVTEVAWWTAYGGAVPPILQAQVDEFNGTHPCIHVTNTQILGGTQGADSERKFLTAVAGGTGPDLWTSSNLIAAPYASAGAVLPLDDYLVGEYAGLKDWLYPAVIEGGSYEGKLYGLPQSMNSEALFYNTDILAEAGATEVPATLEEFDALQDTMWVMNGNQISQIGFMPEPNRIPIYFAQFGGTLNPTDGEYRLAENEGNLELMRWVESYSKYPFSAFSAFLSAIGSGEQAGGDPFTAGRQGFYLNGPWEGQLTIPADNPAMLDSFDVAYFPTTPTGPQGEGPDGKATYVNGNYTFLANGTENPDAAVEFLMWMIGYNNEESTANVLTQIGWLPGSQAIVDSDTYQAWLADNPWAVPIVEVFGSPHSQAMENTLGSNAVNLTLYSVTEAVLTGQMTPEEALEAVDKAGNDALASGGDAPPSN